MCNCEKFIQDSNRIQYQFDKALRDLLINAFDTAMKLGLNKINEFVLFFVLNKYYFDSAYMDLGVTDLEIEGLKIWYKNISQKYDYYKKWKKI